LGVTTILEEKSAPTDKILAYAYEA